MRIGCFNKGKKTFKRIDFRWKGRKIMAFIIGIILVSAGVYGHDNAHEIADRKRLADWQ